MNAIILGWAGATERQLRSVARWYASKGVHAIAIQPRTFRAMAFPSGWAREGARAVARAPAEGPLFVHAFSNAGFWTYAAMLGALSDRSRIRGVVIDSAPGFPP